MKENIPRLLKIALSYKGWMALAALLGFLTVGSGIGLMMTSAYIIAKAALHPSIAELQVGIVGVRFFGIARGIFRYLERYVSHEVAFRLLAKFRVWFYKAIEPLAPAGLQKYKSGDLLTRLVADVESLEHIYVRVIAPPVTALAVSVLMWFLFGIFDVVFSALLLFFFVLAGLGVPLLTRYLSKKTGQELIAIRSQLNEMAIDGAQGMAELLAFGRTPDHWERFNRLNSKYVGLQRCMALVNGMHESLIGLIMNLAVLSILFTAIPMVNASRLDGVFLSVLAIGAMAAFEALLPLPGAAQYLDNSLKAAGRLFQITEAKSAVSDLNAAGEEPGNFAVSVRNLNFSYQPRGPRVLKGLSLEIPDKSAVAVIGSSGAGKSTILNLLVRFWDYEDGEIRIGGQDLRRIPRDRARAYFAVVSQHTHLFNATIYNNIALANPEAGKPEVERCAKQARIHEFIQSLPDGYDTWIGEQGVQLSGGQRQRLAIARAILKNAPILILDEATAHLDVVAEQKILQTIWQIAREKTVIMFTHRLTGLENADKILVLSKGRIVEEGGHAQLLKQKKQYYRLWQMQNQLFELDFLPST